MSTPKTTAYLRVSTIATSEPFTLKNRPPEPMIGAPGAGRTFAAGEAVLLHGSATDAEDGGLDDNALQWQVDGSEQGSGADVIAAGLAPGSHTVVLSATDSNSQTATANASFHVAPLALALTVDGSNFAPDAQVMWNGASLATQFVSPTQVDATLLVIGLVVGGAVRNQTPDVRISAVVPFEVPPPPDLVAPEGTVLINNGAQTTASATVTLTLEATGGATQMQVRNNLGDFAAEEGWIDYATTLPWLLTPSGGAGQVFVWYRDAAGNVSEPANDAIDLSSVAESKKLYLPEVQR